MTTSGNQLEKLIYPDVVAATQMGDGNRYFAVATTNNQDTIVKVVTYWHVPGEGEPVLMIEIDDEADVPEPDWNVRIRIRRNDGLIYEGTASDQEDGEPEEPQVYWDQDPDNEHKPFGEATASIIDLRQGGVVAYCHKDNADRLVRAIWLREE